MSLGRDPLDWFVLDIITVLESKTSYAKHASPRKRLETLGLLTSVPGEMQESALGA